MEPAYPGFISVDLLASGSWQAFERALFRLVLHQGFEWARLTAGAGDRGSDVVGYYRGQYWAIQAKFSLGGAPPGPRVVREELARAAGEYQASQVVLATNASLRDASATVVAATELAANTGIRVSLLDKSSLVTATKSLPQDPPARERQQLRQYQSDAVEAVRAASYARTGQRAGAIVAMATGTGKSKVLFEYIRIFLDERPEDEALVLVETVELARQLERASWDTLPKAITTHLWAGGEVPAYSCGSSVTFATTDSVSASKGILARPKRFALVAFDEAHHAAAEGNRQLIDWLQPTFRLGMTATPWRGDVRQLTATFGDYGPVFKLSVVDAVKLGYLADVDYVVFDDHIDWDSVQRASKSGMSIRDLNRKLWIPERENHVAGIVREWVERVRTGSTDPRTLVFCRSIEHTEQAAHALRTVGLNAMSLHSGLLRFDATRRLQSFRSGEIPVLTVVDMLNEGIDVPDVGLIVFNRVTHSRRVFLQQLGRGLRRTPGKSNLTVLDFVADVRRLAELVQMEREYEAGPKPDEILHLPEHLVSFSSQKLRSFVDAYLADVADLDRLGDDSLELFPAPSPPD